MAKRKPNSGGALSLRFRGLSLPSEFHPFRVASILFLCMFLGLTGILFLLFHAHILFLARMGILVLCAAGGAYFAVTKRSCYLSLFLAFAFLFSWILCHAFQPHPNCTVTDMFYTVCYVLGAALMLNMAKYMKNFGLVSSLAVSGFIGLKMLRGAGVNNILQENSQNYVSVLILFFLLLYYIACYVNREKYYLFPAFVFFLDCVMVQGRGGILVSGLMCVALTRFKLEEIEKPRTRKLMKALIVFMLIALVLIFVVGNQAAVQAFLHEHFERFYRKGAMDADRGRIWKTFLMNNLETPASFLFGSDTTRIRSDQNLHNSYLMCYSCYGLFMFLTILALITVSIVNGIRKKDYFMLMLFGILLLRAMTDKLFFQGYIEIYLYYFFLYFTSLKKNRRRFKTRDSGFLLRLYNTVSNH